MNKRAAIFLIALCSACSNSSINETKVQQEQNKVSNVVTSDSLESTSEVCYESSYAGYGMNQHIQLHEYITLNFKNNVVNGKGAGEAEGNPSWTFTCSGTLCNDSVLRLQVSYKVEGTSPFTLNEEWHSNSSDHKITVKKPAANRPGAHAYNKVDCSSFPDYYVKLLESLKF